MAFQLIRSVRSGSSSLISAVLVACVLAAGTNLSQAADPVYPVKVSGNGRYLVDQNNVPYLLTGDSTQNLTTQLSLADAEMFFADRQAHGFNSDWVNLLTAGPAMAGRNDGSTFDGIRPFTHHVLGGTDWNDYDLTAPDEVFFVRVDQMIRLAARYKIQIILDPAETISWRLTLLNNGAEKCRAYGRYLGNRYKNFDNILWMSGNDFDQWQDPKSDAVATAVALGIKEQDPRHLHTVELARWPQSFHRRPEVGCDRLAQCRLLLPAALHRGAPGLQLPGEDDPGLHGRGRV